MDDGVPRVILVDSHDLFRALFKAFIEKDCRCRVVAEAKCGLEASQKVKTIKADLIILDPNLPRKNGLSIIEEAKGTDGPKILVVTMDSNGKNIRNALRAGADGVCLKDLDLPVIKRAVIETLGGGNPVYTEKQGALPPSSRSPDH